MLKITEQVLSVRNTDRIGDFYRGNCRIIFENISAVSIPHRIRTG